MARQSYRTFVNTSRRVPSRSDSRVIRHVSTNMLLYRYRIYISEQWRTTAESSDERPYNAALEKIASISDSEVEPQTLRLKNEWDKATQNEQRLCVEKADEACRARRAAVDSVCKKCV